MAWRTLFTHYFASLCLNYCHRKIHRGFFDYLWLFIYLLHLYHLSRLGMKGALSLSVFRAWRNSRPSSPCYLLLYARYPFLSILFYKHPILDFHNIVLNLKKNFGACPITEIRKYRYSHFKYLKVLVGVHMCNLFFRCTELANYMSKVSELCFSISYWIIMQLCCLLCLYYHGLLGFTLNVHYYYVNLRCPMLSYFNPLINNYVNLTLQSWRKRYLGE